MKLPNGGHEFRLTSDIDSVTVATSALPNGDKTLEIPVRHFVCIHCGSPMNQAALICPGRKP